MHSRDNTIVSNTNTSLYNLLASRPEIVFDLVISLTALSAVGLYALNKSNVARHCKKKIKHTFFGNKSASVVPHENVAELKLAIGNC